MKGVGAVPLTSFKMTRTHVKGSSNSVYLVSSVGLHPQACTCPDFAHRSGPKGEMCKHMRERAGQSSVGVTRCFQCESMLTVAELDAQPRDRGFLRQDHPRLCTSCFGGAG